MKRRILVTLSLVAGVAFAQQHPNDARGFAADKLYDFHEVDTINMFNGNLLIRVPIGPVFRANALLSYQFTLVYNSHCWHFDEQSNGDFLAKPLATSNAGLGWSLSLGRLFAPFDPANDANSNFWIYESPDGSQHQFYPDLHGVGLGSDGPAGTTGFTRDGTYMRMRTISETERQIDMPDGTTRVFSLLHPTADLQPWLPRTDPQDPDAVWRLVQIKNAKANSVSISYKRSVDYLEIWTVSDPARTSTVNFKATALNTTMPAVLESIVLPAFGGGTATYSFATEQTTLPPPGGALGPEVGISGVRIFLLKSVALPAVNNLRATYSMVDSTGLPAYAGYNNPNPGVALDGSGTLQRLTLPALGSVEWTYARAIRMDFTGAKAGNPAIETPVVVIKRTTARPDGSRTEPECGSTGATLAASLARWGRTCGSSRGNSPRG